MMTVADAQTLRLQRAGESTFVTPARCGLDRECEVQARGCTLTQQSPRLTSSGMEGPNKKEANECATLAGTLL
jgi:hypothetical protein